MAKNPLPILIILLVLGSKKDIINFNPASFNTLQLESFLDHAQSMLSLYDKVNGFAQSGIELPDMKKLMEIVEKIPR